MGAIPTQREIISRVSAVPAHDLPAHPGAEGRTEICVTLPGSPLAPGSARALVRAALTEWTDAGHAPAQRLADDATVVVSELVTSAVVDAGTDVELVCRLEESGTLVIEVRDHHPCRAPRRSGTGAAYETPDGPETPGYGLRLVAALAEAWRRCGR